MKDNELLKLLAESPESGLEQLTREYGALVYTLVKNRLSGTQAEPECEECAAAVFSKFCLSLPRFDPSKGTVKAYLCAIARNEAANAAKAAAAAPEKFDDLADEPASPAAEDEFFESESGRELIAAVNSLPPPDREIIVRRYFYCEPAKTIAKRVGISASAVNTRAHRALKKLKKLLEGKGYDQ